MRVAAGTSGFSYKEWQGAFYPPKLPAARMLEYYAARLPCVELNNTFYRMPSDALVQGWAKGSPAGFQFALKAPRSMTHLRKLADCEEPLGRFVQAASALGAKLGPVLFQLPPFFQKDVARLEAFLAAVPASLRAALEFRHPSWFSDDTYAVLRRHGAALCIADVGGDALPAIVPTAPFGYLRLRREDYSPEQIAAWAAALRSQPFEEAFVFFKHEVKAPELATAFNAHFGAPG